MAQRFDLALWLMPACAVLTLSGVTLLAPRHAAQAAPPPPAAAKSAPEPAVAAYDDGDGDELLEHWGDPKYAREERVQIAGVIGGFLLLGGLAWHRRARRRGEKSGPVALTLVDVSGQKSDQRKAA